MAHQRPPLASSQSFSSTTASTSSPTPFERPLKRSFTTASLFTPSASSFNPRPYAPNANSISAPPRSRMSLTRARSDPHTLMSVGMDPSVNDPTVTFVHPPFTTFPNSEKHPEGLSYNLMAENPEWFLDANDFVTIDTPVPFPDTRLISYPPHLEPPRGWCPARKKDLKERGSEGWPEGEEPRLRCTFCRRTYAGVNAKSMWRRHVFEKHKIAMANRREGIDRPRGRGSTKENRQPMRPSNDHDSLISIEVAPQPFSQAGAHKSKFRSYAPPEDSRRRIQEKDANNNPASSTSLNNEAGESVSPSQPLTPPLTPPQKFFSSDPTSSDEVDAPPSPPILPVIPASPYNPLSTPNWRVEDGPPRLPSPWRYHSPNNPLSKARDLSLSLLAPELTFADSPASVLAKNKIFPKKTPFIDLGTPESMAKAHYSSKYSLISNTHEDSPLAILRKHKKTISDMSDEWMTDLPQMLSGSDPFVKLWEDSQGVANESPVIRRTNMGLGTGLLEPFTLSNNSNSIRGHLGSSSSDVEDEAQVANDLTMESVTESNQPLKKRKLDYV
ncbi:hypothetical protein K435DRAFT_145252 [Dendrothele bispora CBS 962.96]|uniref:Uncharacterized protein n=1 Tax=Dendrothele bispora (strain CBS 962.96) TaxID=1314807 RepID=A0A4S8MPX9_DENBC|nr:hypothetical protein K435DRAFT_145252 [Dendrothele bispora CBS 962.96]